MVDSHNEDISIKYVIPDNVKTRFEFFEGFGWKELLFTSIGVVLGVILYFVVGFFTQHMARLLIIVFFSGIGFFATKPHPRTGKSILDLLKDWKDFSSKPSSYMYRFGEGRDDY